MTLPAPAEDFLKMLLSLPMWLIISSALAPALFAVLLGLAVKQRRMDAATKTPTLVLFNTLIVVAGLMVCQQTLSADTVAEVAAREVAGVVAWALNWHFRQLQAVFALALLAMLPVVVGEVKRKAKPPVLAGVVAIGVAAVAPGGFALAGVGLAAIAVFVPTKSSFSVHIAQLFVLLGAASQIAAQWSMALVLSNPLHDVAVLQQLHTAAPKTIVGLGLSLLFTLIGLIYKQHWKAWFSAVPVLAMLTAAISFDGLEISRWLKNGPQPALRELLQAIDLPHHPDRSKGGNFRLTKGCLYVLTGEHLQGTPLLGDPSLCAKDLVVGAAAPFVPKFGDGFEQVHVAVPKNTPATLLTSLADGRLTELSVVVDLVRKAPLEIRHWLVGSVRLSVLPLPDFAMKGAVYISKEGAVYGPHGQSSLKEGLYKALVHQSRIDLVFSDQHPISTILEVCQSAKDSGKLIRCAISSKDEDHWILSVKRDPAPAPL